MAHWVARHCIRRIAEEGVENIHKVVAEVEAGDIRSLRLGEEELHMLAEGGSRVGAGTAGLVLHSLHYCIPDTQTY